MDIKLENGSRITSIDSSENAKRSNRGDEQLRDGIKYFRKHPDYSSWSEFEVLLKNFTENAI